MVHIILALEGRLGCSFGPSDIQFDHFETIETLAHQLSSIRPAAMRRSSESLAALLGIRRTGADLFRCASSTLVAEEFFLRANLLADKLSSARERIIAPSDDPIAFLAGLAGCWLSNNTAVAWRKSAIDIGSLAELTVAAASIRWDPQLNDWHVDRLSATSTVERPGDVIILTSGSTGKPKGVALDLGRMAVNAALAGSKVGVSSCDFWAVDADMSLMSPLGHTLTAWSSQVPLQHLGGLDWTRRSELFAAQRGGYGGAPLQIRELAQRITGRGPRIIVSSGDFLPPALGAAVDARFPDARASQNLWADRSLRPSLCSSARRAPIASGRCGLSPSRFRSDDRRNRRRQ